uniref:Uncharacterized protein n=1 Tax=Arundo donax TaxID=35708 RepID=A0A0A9AYW7_ARUDO
MILLDLQFQLFSVLEPYVAYRN